ncbi:hypothetical protein BAUCODRAFT_71821 [Baudoinia panamericana UAMH 10762]|uniref:Adenylyltransferase and sulfurtransferase uba4 n=1 Tax=Baudoinia panamericana (strain UAMH 10762) TaxID=717646 RepID=M2MGD9_BAUPA|nr:uncharacterized protein BAUCODRAFT_71821 [Baudoinia panamericana UAMH 10762]EMC95696.1 hypothetical protein BAUCODRAFT_71821 [Baudoinia panamericana UAMH 10762]
MDIDGTTTDLHVSRLRAQVIATEAQLRSLKEQLVAAEQHAEAARHLNDAYLGGMPAEWIGEALSRPAGRRWPLEDEEYKRYGRQLIVPEVGLHGQLRLKNAKVLVIGVGGLGCPAAAYLAGAGVGTLGLVDADDVELSNLHRQIAHSTERIGTSKVDSALEYLQALNPLVNYIRHPFALIAERALQTICAYDLVLDCTDHPTSRYLVSDACVIAQKPLVSASALKTEGQLIVLNNPPRPPGDASGGPCYRCVFPTPPPAESVLSCGEGGILGPVVGVMGVLQALEAVKLLTAKPKPQANFVNLTTDFGDTESTKPSLLMFSAYSMPQFRSVRMRPRRKDCAVCSAQPTISAQSLTSGSLDYIAFCGVTTPVNLLPPALRMTASDFSQLPRDGSNVLIDVRDETQYAICALRGSINVPWTGNADSWLEQGVLRGALAQDGRDRYIICRLGNDSQLAAKAVIDRMSDQLAFATVKDIKNGFRAWRAEVDPSWPDY